MPFTRQRPDGTHDAMRISPDFSLRRLSRLAAVSTAVLCSATLFIPTAFAKKMSGVWGWTSGSATYLRARPSAQTPPVAKVARHTKLFVWGKFNGWYRVETTDHVFGWVYYDYISTPDADKIATLSHKKAKLASDRTGHQTMYGSKQMLASYYNRYGAKGAARGLAKHGVVVGGSRLAKSRPKSSPRVATTRIAKSTPKTAVRIASRPQASNIKRIPGSDRYTNSSDRMIAVPESAFNDVGNVRLRPVSAAALPSAPAAPTAPVRSQERLAPEKPVVVQSPEALQRAANARSARLEAERNARRAKAEREAQQRELAKAEAQQAEAARLAAAQQAAQRAENARLARLENARKAEASKKAAAARLAARRQAERQARASRWQNARKARLARAAAVAEARRRRLASRRDNIRRRMGSVRMAEPPTNVAGMRPISPEELMRARDAYLAGQRQNAPANQGSVVIVPAPGNVGLAPMSWDAPQSATAEAPVQSAFLTSEEAAAVTLPTLDSSERPVTTLQAQYAARFKNTAHSTTPVPVVRHVSYPVTRSVTKVASAAAKPRAKAKKKTAPAVALRGGSPRDRFAAMPNTFGSGMASQALSYRGMPYIRGAASPSRGFDCSGLVYYLLRQRGLNPPRTAAGLASYGTRVSRNDIQTGDMVFFANTYKRGISHIGVYIGNGNFVHAATSRSGVRVDSLSAAYYRKKFHSARRARS
ncbi:MAG TPA: NlpC/P60 family protein [Abditibacteriaceae bacterium]